MARRKTPVEIETDALFDDTMRRVLAIPPAEAQAICERTAPSKPRQVDGLRGPNKYPKRPSR